MYNDPSGEFFVFLGLGVLFWKAVIIGAAVGLASYTVGLAVTGNLHQWNIGGALKATLWGAVSGAVTFGIGSIFNTAAGALTTTGNAIKEAIGGFGLAMVQAGTHAVSQGVMSLMQGGSFEQAFWSGALGSLGASAFGAIAKDAAKSAMGTIAFGAISGGIGAELSGGNFWEGAVIGGVVAGLNHAMHKMEQKSIAKQELNAVGIEDINAIASNTEESLDTVLKTKTLSSMHKDSGKVGISFGMVDDNRNLAETSPNKGYTKSTGIVVNKNKTFSYFKLYQTLGHELTHAIDFYTGAALSQFRRFYQQNKTTAQTRFQNWLEYRAYSWEVKYAPDYWSPIYRDKYKNY